ncbi:hypothetical protein [Clostridium neonatale]|uniref:hypothetical protein n=1 Tax=Clostridium neonatale TaxID=137838 RepID=UPI00291B6C35|nr:conserved hypothetical protein [Clostridium neonatale]
MEWKSYIEKIFFTNNYGDYLADLLDQRELIWGDCDFEKWDSLFNNVQEWKKQFLLSYKFFELASFRAWYIDITFCEFSLPLDIDYNLEEIIAKIFMVTWILNFMYDDTEKNCYRNQSFNEEFLINFNYQKERCAKLSKYQFINELLDIFNHSFNRFQNDKKRKNYPLELKKKLDTEYLTFKKQIQFLERTLHNEEIVRLNTFKLDEYLWYFIKVDTTIYVLQIADFA